MITLVSVFKTLQSNARPVVPTASGTPLERNGYAQDYRRDRGTVDNRHRTGMLERSRLERRLDCRYRFEQPLRYSFEQHGGARLGAGYTVELGGGGVLFRTDCPPPDEASIELSMMWPLLVQGVCSVVLVMYGTVVRTDARGTSVRMHRYRFQTAEPCASDFPMNSGVVCNLIG
jgi:hypothetical protein